MRRVVVILILFSVLFSCKTKEVVSENNSAEEIKRAELIKKIDSYVNGVDSYVYHINATSKDFDSISIDELKWFRKSNHITKHVSEKNKTLYKNKIIKLKKKESLENNFVKLKAFYYDNDDLVCVKIYEIFPSRALEEEKIYQRNLYYNNKELILDSKKSDTKYQTKELLDAGLEQLNEEYQLHLQ